MLKDKVNRMDRKFKKKCTICQKEYIGSRRQKFCSVGCNPNNKCEKHEPPKISSDEWIKLTELTGKLLKD